MISISDGWCVIRTLESCFTDTIQNIKARKSFCGCSYLYSGSMSALKQVCADGRRSLSPPWSRQSPAKGTSQQNLLDNGVFELAEAPSRHALGASAERQQLLLFVICTVVRISQVAGVGLGTEGRQRQLHAG